MLSLIATLSLLAAGCLCSQAEKSPEPAERGRPRETIASLNGTYFLGDGFVNETLELHADGRFSFSWMTDDGGRRHDEGTAAIVDGLLILRVVRASSNRSRAPFSHPRYLPVRWGKRLYLVPENDLLRFCNAVNLMREPREGLFGPFYLRIVWTNEVRAGEKDATLEPASGLPFLPVPWGSFLLPRPLQGRVTEVRDAERATVDLGFEDGLKEGMELLVEEASRADPSAPTRRYGLVRVVAVEAHRSTVEVTQPKLYPSLKKGQKVLSGRPKEERENRPGT